MRQRMAAADQRIDPGVMPKRRQSQGLSRTQFSFDGSADDGACPPACHDAFRHMVGKRADHSALAEMRHDLLGEHFHVVDLAVKIATFRAEPEP